MSILKFSLKSPVLSQINQVKFAWKIKSDQMRRRSKNTLIEVQPYLHLIMSTSVAITDSFHVANANTNISSIYKINSQFSSVMYKIIFRSFVEFLMSNLTQSTSFIMNQKILLLLLFFVFFKIFLVFFLFLHRPKLWETLRMSNNN